MSKLACLPFLVLSVVLVGGCGGDKNDESDVNAANVVAGAIAALNSGDSADVTITFSDYARPGSGTTSLRITGNVTFIDNRGSSQQRVSATSPKNVRVEITLRPSNGTTYSF